MAVRVSLHLLNGSRRVRGYCPTFVRVREGKRGHARPAARDGPRRARARKTCGVWLLFGLNTPHRTLWGTRNVHRLRLTSRAWGAGFTAAQAEARDNRVSARARRPSLREEERHTA